MNTLVLILGMGAALFTLRLAGFLLSERTIPSTWEIALGFVPVATLASLVISTLISRPDEMVIRIVAAAGAGFLVASTGRPWVCILGGMAIYWLLRLAF